MNKDTTRIAAAEFGCSYVIAYVGRCGRIATVHEHARFCSDHALKRCSSCGGQATHECSYTGQFVCGAPLCGDCEGWEDRTKSGGSWGFMNHSHRLKPVERRQHAGPRQMVEGDVA